MARSVAAGAAYFALLLLCLAACAEAAPFFDAIYAAINGNTRQYPSYGYGGYGGYGGYARGYEKPQPPERQGKSYKEICRVHNPQAWGSACPY